MVVDFFFAGVKSIGSLSCQFSKVKLEFCSISSTISIHHQKGGSTDSFVGGLHWWLDVDICVTCDRNV